MTSLTLCANCGKEFKISMFKKFFGDQTICPNCRDEKETKIRRYVDAVNYFGKDNYLSKDEEKTLQELKSNFGLKDEDIVRANKELEKLRRLTSKNDITTCEQKIAEFFSNGQINQKDESDLAEMMRSLGVVELIYLTTPDSNFLMFGC
jgi:hypothetical protein